MDKLYKAKFFYFIFLLPIFLMNKNLFSHSSFFWLARLESVSAGAMGPLRHQMDSCYKKKDFDEPISENNEYGEQARNIADFFIKKYKNELPSTISSEKLLDDIICYSKIEGSSIDLILYAELLARHKKIDLNGIYIAGSGQIDVATGVCNSVTSLFHKLNAGIYYGIRIFIFSSQQKKDIENCCNSYIHNGGDQVIQQISFYYVDNVDQLEGVLCDISKTKKKAYDRKAI